MTLDEVRALPASARELLAITDAVGPGRTRASLQLVDRDTRQALLALGLVTEGRRGMLSWTWRVRKAATAVVVLDELARSGREGAPTMSPPRGMTALFSFDAETDGLYGAVWAIGAVVIEPDGTLSEAFNGQLDPDVVTDSWTRENVVPVVRMVRYESRENLLNAFWAFWLRHRERSIAMADCGSPVEAGLIRACVELDREARQWQGPYPLHELGTLLLLHGLDVHTDRRELAGQPDLVPHDPVHDAIASGLCWQKLA